MFDKGGVLFLVKISIFFFFIPLFSVDFSSALSMSPASISINFEPNFKETFDYQVSGTTPGKNYSLYVEGDLAEYITLSKNELKGNDFFKVSVSLPKNLDKPGRRMTYVGIKESVDEELSGGTIGTAVELKALIAVYVPYPGKYVEITSFTSENANVGEIIDFKLEAVNRGKQSVNITPSIDIFSNQTNEFLTTLNLDTRFLEPTQKISLHKNFDTASFNAGKYNAILSLEYGGEEPSVDETFFRIGELGIEIKNYTNLFIIDGKIQKFNIELESGWNDKIDGVYADVSFFNETSEVLFFKTSSTSLNPWEIKTITGYFDTSNFVKGNYNANITLFYYGKEVGASSGNIVDVRFIEKSFNKAIVLVSAGILILVLLAISIFFMKKRLKKSKK